MPWLGQQPFEQDKFRQQLLPSVPEEGQAKGGDHGPTEGRQHQGEKEDVQPERGFRQAKTKGEH